MSKKMIWTIAIIAVVVVAIIVVVALNSNKSGNVSGTLEELMAKVYEGIPEEELPMMLGNNPVNNENVEGYIGTTEVAYKEALANESMVGSIAHSVVLLRLNDAKDAEAAVDKIKTTINPRKWICVEASNVVVKSKGDLVLLVMSNQDLAPKLEANFDNL